METDGGQGATKVNEDDIIGVVREYLEDKENSYALMLTGEWGCGKTYFVEHALTEKLEEDESRHPVVVASAYGAKDLAELCGAIESGFISKYAIGCAAGGERGRWDSLVGFAKDTGISFLGKKIRELEKKAGVDLKMAPLNAVNLIIGPETLLVIDDVERCDMGIRELLGAVDHLVVGCRKKVLLVCNEDEWRKGLGPKGEKGTTREYESLIEKTVWRKCRFRPSVGSVVERVLGGVLGGIYPGALEDAVSAIEGSESPNLRSLSKMRPVLVGMKESGFFAEPTDPESARAVFKEAFGFAAGRRRGCASGLRQAGRIPSLGVAFSSRAGSNTPLWTSSPAFSRGVRGSIPSMFVPAWKITLRPFIPTGRPRGKLLNVSTASDTPLSAMPMSLAWWRL